MSFSMDFVENSKDRLSSFLQKATSRHKGLFYADVRLEASIARVAYAFNGNIKDAEEDKDYSLGVRAFVKNAGVTSVGFAGMVLGQKQLQNLSKVLDGSLALSLKRARINSEQKKRFVKKHALLSQSVGVASFLQEQSFVDSVDFAFKKNPLDCSLEEIINRAENVSGEVGKINGIASNDIGIACGFEKKVFANTSGSLIEQTWPFVQGFVFVAAKGKATETYYDWVGNFKGLEVLEGENEFSKNFEDFCEFISKGTVEVSNAPVMKTTAKEQTVITDPWFNALLSHEIMGHPSEADRALKKEAAWAGRAWWFNGVKDNFFEKPVGSDELSVFSDPSLSGYGNYKYDDEGTLAKKTVHIKNGVLTDFLNGVETSQILGRSANGGMRAMSAANVPLIRMNNTFIAPGKWKKDELFEETRSGYYLVGQKTPSIGETRQNFKITCWKLYRIENGEIGQLFRQGGISGDSHTFFESIDGVADDFVLFNIPNCGKGTPMQTMRVGNGGPHVRAKAVVSGAH